MSGRYGSLSLTAPRAMGEGTLKFECCSSMRKGSLCEICTTASEKRTYTAQLNIQMKSRWYGRLKASRAMPEHDRSRDLGTRGCSPMCKESFSEINTPHGKRNPNDPLIKPVLYQPGCDCTIKHYLLPHKIKELLKQ